MKNFINRTLHQIKDDEMDVACSANRRDEKWVQNFSRKTWRVETTWKTYMKLGGY